MTAWGERGWLMGRIIEEQSGCFSLHGWEVLSERKWCELRPEWAGGTCCARSWGKSILGKGTVSANIHPGFTLQQNQPYCGWRRENSYCSSSCCFNFCKTVVITMTANADLAFTLPDIVLHSSPFPSVNPHKRPGKWMGLWHSFDRWGNQLSLQLFTHMPDSLFPGPLYQWMPCCLFVFGVC